MDRHKKLPRYWLMMLGFATLLASPGCSVLGVGEPAELVDLCSGVLTADEAVSLGLVDGLAAEERIEGATNTAQDSPWRCTVLGQGRGSIKISAYTTETFRANSASVDNFAYGSADGTYSLGAELDGVVQTDNNSGIVRVPCSTDVGADLVVTLTSSMRIPIVEIGGRSQSDRRSVPAVLIRITERIAEVSGCPQQLPDPTAGDIPIGSIRMLDPVTGNTACSTLPLTAIPRPSDTSYRSDAGQTGDQFPLSQCKIITEFDEEDSLGLRWHTARGIETVPITTAYAGDRPPTYRIDGLGTPVYREQESVTMLLDCNGEPVEYGLVHSGNNGEIGATADPLAPFDRLFLDWVRATRAADGCPLP